MPFASPIGKYKIWKKCRKRHFDSGCVTFVRAENRRGEVLMGKIWLIALAGALLTFSTQAQGTINFYNRGLTGPNGTTYNSPLSVTDFAIAQLFVVSGNGASAQYIPVEGMQSFRPYPNHVWFKEPVLATVPNHPPGTEGVQLVVRAWVGASWQRATLRAQTEVFTVGPLGGENPSGGPAIPLPDLGGPGGIGGLSAAGTFVPWPEPSTYAIAIIGAVLLIAYRRK